jgi:hypothetical protein
MTTCQPSGLDAAGDLHQLVLGREVDQPLDEVEAHAAHAGGVQRLQLGVADAAPHGGHAARPAAAARQASTSARLSAPWQVACTMTLRAKPRWSRSANSCALLASQGVYLRSGA